MNSLSVKLTISFCFLTAAALPLWAQSTDPGRPNVIFILTDDQGWADLGAHGNKDIITPNLDQMYNESFALTNFHSSPLCAPTRAALLTGRYTVRNKVWGTTFGRALLPNREVTMAEVFKHNGYKTGMWGKWHLGSISTMAPEHQGFDEVLSFGGGTVNSIPSHWNHGMSDTWWRHNGEWEYYDGYCTDVWFDEAMKWIKDNKEDPFFAFIPTNAPHAPFAVPVEFSDMYNGTRVEHPVFYGMITFIDHKIGQLREFLEEEGLAHNTLLIFMTDNGSVANFAIKWENYDAGLRGAKGSMYDGGHRVPMIMHWPAGNLRHGETDETLTSHIDMLPTFMSLFDFTYPEKLDLDGTDISRLLTHSDYTLPERTVILPKHGGNYVPTYEHNVVMKDNWRLIIGKKELYNMDNDWGQQNNLYSQNPEMVKEFTDEFEIFWNEVKPQREGFTWIHLGDERQNPTLISSHEWQPKGKEFVGFPKSNPKRNGYWTVYINQDGRYNFTLRKSGYEVSSQESKNLMSDVSQARLVLREMEGNKTWVDTTVNVSGSPEEVNIELDLKRDSLVLQTWLDLNNSQGAFYTYVTRLSENTSVTRSPAQHTISANDIPGHLATLGSGEYLQILLVDGTLLFDSRRNSRDRLHTLNRNGFKLVKISGGLYERVFKLVR